MLEMVVEFNKSGGRLKKAACKTWTIRDQLVSSGSHWTLRS